jgi:ferredoxin
MAYIITEPCIGVKDTGCIDVCPMDCIHGTENDPMLYIDPTECIDCGGCVPACPADAIFPETEVPDQWKHYTQSNAGYFNNKK